MIATIENLRDGKCALWNKYGELKDLKIILKKAFPKDSYITDGSSRYYEKSSIYSELFRYSNNTDLPSFSIKEFINNLSSTKTTMKNRTLKPSQAQSIINIACAGVWKPKLAKLWGESIVMGNDIPVTETFYKEMRKACTPDQNKLFDTIFGKDEKLFTAKKGDWVVILEGPIDDSENSFTLKTPYQLSKDFISDNGHFDVVADNEGDPNGYSNVEGFKFRKATAAEIKKVSWYPHLTPCLVRDASDQSFKLQYSSKVVNKFYCQGRKSGQTTSWLQHQKLDINNLP